MQIIPVLHFILWSVRGEPTCTSQQCLCNYPHCHKGETHNPHCSLKVNVLLIVDLNVCQMNVKITKDYFFKTLCVRQNLMLEVSAKCEVALFLTHTHTLFICWINWLVFNQAVFYRLIARRVCSNLHYTETSWWISILSIPISEWDVS